MKSTLIFSYINLIYFVLLWANTSGAGKQYLRPVKLAWVFPLLLLCVICVHLAPIGFDKLVYTHEYLIGCVTYITKEPGWWLYNLVIYKLVGRNTDIFFIINTTVYLVGFLYCGIRFFGKQRAIYFIVAAGGILGFLSGVTNIMRAGLATAVVMVALSYHDRKYLPLILLLCSCLIHKSMALVGASYVVAMFYHKPKVYLCFWFTILVLSAANVTSNITELLPSFVNEYDERLADYINNKDMTADGQYMKSGFRWDFIIYSFYSIAVGLYYNRLLKRQDKFYNTLLCTYMLINAFWLVVIRVAYADRFAFLSWNLIALLLVYPAVKYPNLIRPTTMFFFLMPLIILSLVI